MLPDQVEEKLFRRNVSGSARFFVVVICVDRLHLKLTSRNRTSFTGHGSFSQLFSECKRLAHLAHVERGAGCGWWRCWSTCRTHGFFFNSKNGERESEREEKEEREGSQVTGQVGHKADFFSTLIAAMVTVGVTQYDARFKAQHSTLEHAHFSEKRNLSKKVESS